MSVMSVTSSTGWIRILKSKKSETHLELHDSSLVYDRLSAGVGLLGTFGGEVAVNNVVVAPAQQTGCFAFSAGTPMFKGGTAIISRACLLKCKREWPTTSVGFTF